MITQTYAERLAPRLGVKPKSLLPQKATTPQAHRSPLDHLAELATTVDDLIESVADLKDQVAELQRQRATAQRATGGP